MAVVAVVGILALIAGLSAEHALTVSSYQQGEDRVVEMNGVKMTLKYVQAGSFMMGSPTNEKDRENVETQHRVTLTKDYWIGETEVTQEQYKAVMGRNPSSFSKGGKYPVERVSWTAAMAFCERLTKAERENGNLPEGYEYTLPTEAQWEYASRGGPKAGRYHVYSGSDEIHNVAWYNDNSNRSTHPVGQKRPNELGLYDMSGNVREWCSDWFSPYYYKPNVTYKNPKGPSKGTLKILKGGSWSSEMERTMEYFMRAGCDTSLTALDMGFRIVLDGNSPTDKTNF